MPKAKKTPSGKWRVRVYVGRDEFGHPSYKSITADTKKDAEYLALAFMTQKHASKQCMTIGEAVDRYIKSKSNVLSPSTIDSYQKIRRNHIVRIERIKIDCVTREDIQKWVNSECTIVSAKTVCNVYGLLRSTISMYRPDFVFNIRLPRKARKLKRDLPTSEEVFKAVHGKPVELPVLLALWLCLRLSEVRGIKKSAIHGDELYIENVIVTINREHVEKQLTKTDSTRRIVKLPKQLKEMILSQDGEYATKLTGKAIYSQFTRLMEKAGYKNIRFHDLRHIAASDMNRLGITDRVAADRGGWSTTATMRNVYQHSFTPDRDIAENIVNDYYTELFNMTSEDTDDSLV